MLNNKYVAIQYVEKIEYPIKEDRNWFGPGVGSNYPELYYVKKSNNPNYVYDAVRNLLYLYKMDQSNYGTENWNPMGEIIKPGDKVLLKPNLVMDYNQSNEGTECLYTQPSVVAPIIDYVIKALDGRGEIVIGDAPMQECKFDKLLEESGYKQMIEYYSEKFEKSNMSIRIVDFRGLVTNVSGKNRKGVRQQTIRANAKGTVIDLAEDSEFAQYDGKHLANMRITNYSPDRLKSHHCPGKHEYYVTDYVLNADVVISIPKPKTHRKAGFTAAMKNMVGINVRKEYLPHHTIGSKEEGGDEYRTKSVLRRIDDILYDEKNSLEGKKKYRLAKFYWYIAGAVKVLCNLVYRQEAEGNWYGNETISKTIVDLNKILLYADKRGIMHNNIQRKVLNIGDMIISGEKEGPVAPSSKKVGAVLIGSDSFAFDVFVGTMMGAEIDKIPFIRETQKERSKYKIYNDTDVCVVSNKQALRCNVNDIPENEKWRFCSTSGWKKVFNQ